MTGFAWRGFSNRQMHMMAGLSTLGRHASETSEPLSMFCALTVFPTIMLSSRLAMMGPQCGLATSALKNWNP